jgi:hypothetical protein
MRGRSVSAMCVTSVSAEVRPACRERIAREGCEVVGDELEDARARGCREIKATNGYVVAVSFIEAATF